MEIKPETIIALVVALIGLIGALLNRKQIVVHRSVPDGDPSASGSRPPASHRAGAPASRGSQADQQPAKRPVTLFKRIKRLFISTGIAVGLFALATVVAPRDLNVGAIICLIPSGLFLLLAVYQVTAIVIIMLFRLWR